MKIYTFEDQFLYRGRRCQVRGTRVTGAGIQGRPLVVADVTLDDGSWNPGVCWDELTHLPDDPQSWAPRVLAAGWESPDAYEAVFPIQITWPPEAYLNGVVLKSYWDSLA